MARQYAPIHLSIWNAGGDFRDLGVEAQHIYFLIFSQSKMTYCGVVPYQPRMWAQLSKGNNVAKVKRAVTELKTCGYVIIDENTEELWVRTFVRHNKILEQAQLHKSMNESYEHIASLVIKRAFYDSLPAPSQRQLMPPCPPPCPAGSQSGSLAECSGSDGTGIQTLSKGLDLDPDTGTSPVPPPGPEPTPPPETSTAPASSDDEAESRQSNDEIAQHVNFEKRVWRWTDTIMDRFGFAPSTHLRLGGILRLVCQYVDDRLVEEAVTYCDRLDTDHRPQTPQFLEVTIGEWAEQRQIPIPGIRKRRAS